MSTDPVSLSVALVAVAAVLFSWLVESRDRRSRTQQLRILAKHAKALEEMVKAQGEILSALQEGKSKSAPDWFAEAERRRRAAESDPALAVWDDLEDLVGRE